MAELYTYLTTKYLPVRYPTLFSIKQQESGSSVIFNHANQESYPTIPPADPIDGLKILGELVEDDLILVQQTEEGLHQAVGFVCCFPSGFNPKEKVGKVLRDVHGPVPGYDKIEASMERFFGRLEAGKNVRRVNVSTARVSYHVDDR